MKDYITIIGGGLAGCEAAYQIAKQKIKVKIWQLKRLKKLSNKVDKLYLYLYNKMQC